MKWPLPLTPIEELFFVDDRPAYPCCCFVRAEFSGALDRAKLETAVQKILLQHPLLTARIENRGSRFVWVPAEVRQPVIAWKLGTADEGYPPAIHLDLRAESGVRFLVVLTDSTCTLFIQFHHAVCDGVGIFQFLHELLVEYGAMNGTSRGAAPYGERWERERRAMSGCSLARQLLMAPQRLLHLWEARTLLLRKPSALLPAPLQPHTSPIPHGFPAAVSIRLTPEETAGLQQAARKLGIALNDLLVRDAFMACHAWRKSHNLHSNEDWLRMAVPVNLREAGEAPLPVSNVVSMVFLDRCDLNFDDLDALLASVHHEMNRNKRDQLSHLLPLALALSRRLPGGLRKHLWANKCLISSVFSNLGVMFQQSPLADLSGHLITGGVRLDTVEMLPPVRPYMAVAFAVGTYAGQFWSTLHYDPRPVTETQAHDLARSFHQRLLASINSAQ